ncbi:hypothetical protein N7451_011926 [Penicillium sp. IBT 35674x]|nr:hypothetical protein N7451_011926 [Penicillium sp. IBT 35674x]
MSKRSLNIPTVASSSSFSSVLLKTILTTICRCNDGETMLCTADQFDHIPILPIISTSHLVSWPWLINSQMMLLDGHSYGGWHGSSGFGQDG